MAGCGAPLRGRRNHISIDGATAGPCRSGSSRILPPPTANPANLAGYTMTKQALIVVDIQNDYFPGGKWVLDGVEAAADNAARIIDAARRDGDLVIHIRHETLAEGAPFFVPATDGAQLHPKAMNLPGETVIVKNFMNPYRETPLKSLLDQHGIENVTVIGNMSHMC